MTIRKKIGYNQDACSDCKSSGKPCDGKCNVNGAGNSQCQKPIEDISECYKNTAELTCTSIRATSTFIAVSAEKALLQENVFTEMELVDSIVFSLSWAFLINSIEPGCVDNLPAFAKVATVLCTSQLFADLAADRDPSARTFLVEIMKKYIALSIMDSMLV